MKNLKKDGTIIIPQVTQVRKGHKFLVNNKPSYLYSLDGILQEVSVCFSQSFLPGQII